MAGSESSSQSTTVMRLTLTRWWLVQFTAGSLMNDLRAALRQLRKNPGFAFVAVLTLALGIGVTTAIFSVVYGILLRPLPYTRPDRLVAINEITNRGRLNALADPNFDDFRDQSHSFEAMAKYGGMLATVTGASPPARAIVARVSPQFLRVFGVQPIAGRDFTTGDARKDAAPTALVNYGYWTQFLGSRRDLSNATLKIDGTVVQVIGVLPAGFRFPPEAEFWVPTDLKGENPSRTSHNHRAVARLGAGVTVAQANGDVSAIARRIYAESNEKGDYLLVDGRATPLQESIAGRAKPPLLILLGAVGFLLLVACANVAHLLLAQASVRERELAVRCALGAGRGRLVRQFVTEAFVLSLLGCSFGLLGAYSGVIGLLALAPPNLPRLDEVSINLPVLAFVFLLCCGVAIGIGIFTALRATAGDVRLGLAEGSREQASSQSSQRVGRGIVAAQIAITLVLVVGAGLLGRSLMKVLEVNPGFRVEKIVTMDVSLPRPDWTDWKAKAGQAIFFRNLIERLKQIPGVRQVGATSDLPMTGWVSNGQFLPMTQNELPKNPTTLQELSRDFDLLFRQKERLGE